LDDSDRKECTPPFVIESKGTVVNRPWKAIRESALFALIIFILIEVHEMPKVYLGHHHGTAAGALLTGGAFAALSFLFWLCLPLLVRRSLAEKIEISESGVAVYRVGGARQSLEWKKMTAVGWDSSQTELLLRGHDEHIWVNSFGFDDPVWDQMMSQIRRRMPSSVTCADLTGDYNRHLCSWLERLTPPTVMLGILSSLFFISRGDKVGLILAAGIAITLMVIYAALYDHAGLGRFESPVLNFLGIIRFYGIKLLAAIPLIIIYLFLLCPAPGFTRPAVKIDILYYVANGMFFGGMALALIIGEGLSYPQFKSKVLHGLNAHHRKALIIALIMCATGFLMKMWNES
jgi:hypothetical protein